MDIEFSDLKQHLPNLQLHLFETLDSTSDYLKRHRQQLVFPSLCYTPNQVSGRGTFHKPWYASFEDLTFSLALFIPKPISELKAFSILVGLTTLKVLKAFKPEDALFFKWPNDIYLSADKVAGILIEVLQHDGSSTHLSIGIGINLGSVTQNCEVFGQHRKATLGSVNKSKLLEALVVHLLKLTEREHFLLTQDELQYAARYDFFQPNESLQLIQKTEVEWVTYLGLNEQGACCVKKNGQKMVLQSVQHSLRKQDKE